MRALIIVLAMGSCGPQTASEPSDTPAEAAEDQPDGRRLPSLPGTARVGNDDPRGAGSVPDYDAMAISLRERFGPHFREHPPPPVATACARMLDAVRSYYRTSIDDQKHQTKILGRLKKTRAADQEACEADTSAKAAVCTTMRLQEEEGEYAWLLDQCSRAFP